jgi:hypothetical protein
MPEREAMKVIRTTANTFEELLPLIKQEESNSSFYVRHESDNNWINPKNWVLVYFDDRSRVVTFEDRIPK